MSKTTIQVMLTIELPDNVSVEDIEDWVDVQYGECNSMNSDNPCQENYEVVDHGFEVIS